MIHCKNCTGTNSAEAVYCMHCGVKVHSNHAAQHNTTVRYITAGLLVVGLVPWPYGYYLLLRVIVFCVFGNYFLKFRKQCVSAKREVPVWVWALGGFALLFIPFIPAFLFRSIWAVFDIAGAFVIVKTIAWEKQL